MKIKDLLAPSDVLVDFAASNKRELLNILAARAANGLKLSTDSVVSDIQKRDELGSTGIGGGVSIPHARLREVQRPCGLLARLKQPVDYQAIDGQPVDLVFMLLLPTSSQLDQRNALATVARKLRDQTVLRRARIAGSASELYRAMTE